MAINPSWDELTQREDYKRLSPEGQRRLKSNYETEHQKAQAGREANPQTQAVQTEPLATPETGVADPTKRFKPYQAAEFTGRQIGRQMLSTVQAAQRTATGIFGSPGKGIKNWDDLKKGGVPTVLPTIHDTIEKKVGEVKDELYPSADKDRYQRAEGKWAGFGEDVVGAFTQFVPQVAAMLTPGGAPAALGIGATQMFGSQYDDLEKDVGHERAAIAATAQASINTVFEKFGLEKIMKGWKASGAFMPFMKKMGESALTEGITEFAQKYPEYLMDIWARTEGQSDSERADMFFEGLAEATKEALYEGLLGGIVGGTVSGGGAAVAEVQQKFNKQKAPDLTEFGFTQQFQQSFEAGDLKKSEVSVNDLLRMKQNPELFQSFETDENTVNDMIVSQFKADPDVQVAVSDALESDMSPEFISGIAAGMGLHTKGAAGTEFTFKEQASEGMLKNQAQANLRRSFQNNELNVQDLMGIRQDKAVMEQYNLDEATVDAVLMEHFESIPGGRPAVQIGAELGLNPEVIAQFGLSPEATAKLNQEPKAKKAKPEKAPVTVEKKPGANAYFHRTEDSYAAPIDEITARNEIIETEASKKKGALAARLMDEAAAEPDNLEKTRKPVTVVTRPDGKKILADGNTTWHELKRRGETHIEVVEGNAVQSRKKTPDEPALRKAAKESLPEADSLIQGWAKKHGAQVLSRKGGLKSKESVDRKIKEKYSGVPAMVTDMIAQTLAFETDAELLAALKEIQNDPKVITWENRYDKPLPSGYRDVTMDIRLDTGHIMELQLNTKATLSVKDKLHGLYEVVRKFPNETGLTTKEKANFSVLLDEMMRKGYEASSKLSTTDSALRAPRDLADFDAALSSTLEDSYTILSFMSGDVISSKLSPTMRKTLSEVLSKTKGALSEMKKIRSSPKSASVGTDVSSSGVSGVTPSTSTVSTKTPKVNTFEGLRSQVAAVVGSPKQVDAILGLIEARAKSAGMTPDQYIDARGLLIEKTTAKATGVSLKQKAKGAFDTRQEGKSIIKAFEAADISTLAHEIGHLFRRDLELSKNTGLLKTAEKWAGVENGKWTVAQEEKFARAFERYLRTGNAPTGDLQSVFDTFKQWLSRIYKSLTGSSLDVKMHPDIISVFDSLLTEGGAKEKQVAVEKLFKKDPKLKVQVDKLDSNLAGGLEYNMETGQLQFHPVKAALSSATGEHVLFQGIEKPGKDGRFLRGKASKQNNVDVAASILESSALINEWDQVGSIEEAQVFADNIQWMNPEVRIEKKDLRWKDKKGAKGYLELGKDFYGNDKMAFPNYSYPKGRNTWDIPGCGREAWAVFNGVDAAEACYGGGCYAERLKSSKQGKQAGITKGINKVGVSGNERTKVNDVLQKKGLERARKEFPEYEFLVIKADGAFKKKINAALESGGKAPANAVKQADGNWQKITVGYFKNAKGEKIPYNEVQEATALAAVVTTNLQPSKGVDIRLGVDTDGAAWLADKRVMDAIMKADPRTLTVYSSAYHSPPVEHELSGRTIINVTISGWHPIPETLSRIRWAEKARANGWNVILREVAADPDVFEAGLVKQYNRVHDAIMATDFFVMGQPLHLGATHGKPMYNLPSCCVGSETNVHTCDQCEVSEGLGLGFQEYWEINENIDSDEIVLPDSEYEGRQILFQAANIPWKEGRGERGQTYRKLDPKDAPKNTRTVYKLMRVMPTRPGAVFPLYAKPEDGKAQGFTAGEWFAAENQRPRGLAERPGIHAVSLPVFDQGKAKVEKEKRVWVEVEMPVASKKTQAESDTSPQLPNGMRSGITQRLIDINESYDFKTNPGASKDAAGWPIAGSAKVVRILGDEEVATILKENGLDHQIENSTTGYKKADAKEMSNWLDPKLLLQTDTPNFKKWFRKSKVVNGDGSPAKMFHGTRSKESFTEFKLTKARENSLGHGFYFSDSGDHAAMYAPRKNAMPVYLSIQNPFVMNWRTEAGRNASVEAGKAVGISVLAGNWINGKKEEITAKLKAAGYDGVVVLQPAGDETPAHKETVAFDPRQIKSVFNEGAWDQTNPDILLQTDTEQMLTDFLNNGDINDKQYQKYSTEIDALYAEYAPPGAKSWSDPRELLAKQIQLIRDIAKEAGRTDILLQSDTPEFKSFWKKSKITEKDGTPKTMYHGTKRNFTQFESAYGHGMTFFTTNPEFASTWPKGYGGLRAVEPSTEPYIEEMREIANKLSDKYLKEDYDFQNEESAARYEADRAKMDAAMIKATGYRNYVSFESVADIKVIPVYLSVQKPFDPPKDYKKLEKFLRTQAGMNELVDKGYHKKGNWIIYENDAVVTELKRLGYDGLYINENQDGPHETVAIFEPTQAKSIWNEGTWNQKEGDILLQKAEVLNQAAERSSNWDLPENDTRWQSIRYGLQDKLDPLRRAQEVLPNMDADSDVYTKESLRAAKSQAAIDGYHEEVINPFLEKLAKSGYKLEFIEKLAYAMHAREANARLRRVNARRYLQSLLGVLRGDAKESLQASLDAYDETATDEDWGRAKKQQELLDLLERSWGNTKPERALKAQWDSEKDKLSGMSDNSALTFLHEQRKKTKAFDLAIEMQQLTEQKIEVLVDAGILSKDEAKAWRQYEHYVPLRREGFDDEISAGVGKGISGTAKASKMRAGSTRRATNILANIVGDMEAAIDRAGRAESARALLKMVEDNPNPHFWEVNKSKKMPRYDADGNVVMYSDSTANDKNEVSVRVDGEQWIIRFGKDSDVGTRIAKALNGKSQEVGKFVNAMGWVTRYLAMMNTSLSPEFVVSNFFRDIQTAMVNIDSTAAKNIELKVAKDVKKSGKGIWKALRGDKDSEWSQVWEDYKKHGGKVTWMSGHDSPMQGTKNLEAKMKALSEGKINFLSMQSARDFFKTIEDVNTAVENAVRLSFYKHAVDSGMSKEDAALAGKELTTNFERKGAGGQTLNAFYMFANAGIQGSTRIFKALKHSNKARAMVGSIAAAGFLANMFNRFLGGDDDDDEAYIDKVPDYVKERNMVFIIPGSGGKYAKIPMPWGYNIFWVLGDQIGDAGFDPDFSLMESAGYTAISAMNAFNPLQAATFLQTIFPTITDPFVQIGENKSWAGTPLKPEAYPGDLAPKPEYQMHWDSARTPSKLITKALNSLTGGDEVHAGKINWSPEYIDVFWDTFTGSAGRFVADSIDLPVKIAKGEIGDIEVKDIPFARRLSGSQSEFADRTAYYENLKPVAEAAKRMKLATGNRTEIAGIKSEYGAEVSLIPALKSSRRKLRKLTKNRDRLKKNDAPKAEIDAVKTQINDVYGEFNKKYYAKTRSGG